jgi:hypothetical protein
LAFQHAPILRQFQGSTGPDVLKEALQATLGADLEVSCVLHNAALHGEGSAEQAAAPQAAAPAYADFAPGDEAVPDDPDRPAPQAIEPHEAAVELLTSQLGGKVISTTGDD